MCRWRSRPQHQHRKSLPARMKEAANRGGLRVKTTAYCSPGPPGVKLPLEPLALIWLLPKGKIEPALADTPVPLPPIVEAPTSTFPLAEFNRMPTFKLSITLDSSTVK